MFVVLGNRDRVWGKKLTTPTLINSYRLLWVKEAISTLIIFVSLC